MLVASPRAASAADIVDVVRALHDDGRDLCPPGTDPREWAGDVLADLAAAVEHLDGAVHRLSGRPNPAVRESTRRLAAAITAHRNIALGTPRAPGTAAGGPAPRG